MCADDNLSPASSLNVCDERRQLRHYAGIEGKFRFLQQKERITLKERPKKAD